MLPIKLELQGLYSYQDKQIIDFSNLTSSGLFGIFGGVGSGKSSILEAISFALYGETERLNSRDGRGYNMLNLRCNEAYIAFEFSNFQGRIFKFTVSWKRKKKFEETTSIERLAYEWIEDHWLPLESADGSKVIGLTYDNFRRTIIIPQGKFKEFLELRGKDRSEMMKEIFNLQQYDLAYRVSGLQKQNNDKIENIKGALSGFEEVSLDVLEQAELGLKHIQEVVAERKQQVDQLRVKREQLLAAQLVQEALEKAVAAQQNLLQQQHEVQVNKRELKRFDEVEAHFKQTLEQLQKQQLECDLLSGQQSEIQREIAHLTAQWEQKEAAFVALQPIYQALDTDKQRLLDWEHSLELLTIRQLLAEKVAQLEKGGIYVLEQSDRANLLRLEVKKSELELEQQKSQRTDGALLLALGSWYHEQQLLARQFGDQQLKVSENLQAITAVEQQFEARGLNAAQWEEDLKERQEQIAVELRNLQQTELGLKVSAELRAYAGELHAGVACPLCGSPEHPHPLKQEAVPLELAHIAEEIQSTTQRQQQLQHLQVELSGFTHQIAFHRDQHRNLETALADLEKKLQTHRRAFIWPEYSPLDSSDFQRENLRSQDLEQQIKLGEQALKELRTASEYAESQQRKAEQRIQQIQSEIAGLEGQQAQRLAQIKLLQPDDYFERSAEAICAIKDQLQVHIQQTTQLQAELSQALQFLKPELAVKQGRLEQLEQQLAEFVRALESSSAQFDALLNLHGFTTVVEVVDILNQSTDWSALRLKIEAFEAELKQWDLQVERLQMEAKAKPFDAVELEKLQGNLISQQSDLEKHIGQGSALEAECKRLKGALDKKGQLLEQALLLDKRAANLSTMANLFKANGFVNYVSSIYLQNLCEVANLRFHRLTRNQLSLTLNDNNEFEVIDYLNNGYPRSMKTLSGGQGFQASLCLALALAESIQALNKSDKNFFFIDEGFGTQDAESINTVFETLQYLHKENRIVGIISHVEELKERIPSSITVVKEEGRGSQIHWNN